MKKIERMTVLDYDENILEEKTTIKTFDDQSRIIEEIEQLPDETKVWRKVFEYKEHEVRETLFIQQEEVQLNEIKFNASGLKVQEITTDKSDNTIYKWTLDDSTLIGREEEYNEDLELISSLTKHFDREGNIIKEIEEDDYQTIYKYENGKLLNVQIIDGETLVLEENYFYDENGNEIRSLGIDHETKEETEVTKMYNDHFKIIKEEQRINSVLMHTKLFEYNPSNELIGIESDDKLSREIEIVEYENIKD